MQASELSLNEIIKSITPIDEKWVEKAKDRTAQLVMPPRALGRLHEISEKLCGIRETLSPSVSKKAVLVMAGDHGIAAEGTSAFPQDVTGAMVQTFLNNGAGINAISGYVGADVWVVDMGIIPDLTPEEMQGGEHLKICKIAHGTQNFTKGPAMTREEAEKAVLAGFQQATELFEKGVDVLGTGDMGIGNTTPSAAIGAVLTGQEVEKMAGRGTGVDDEGYKRKCRVIERGIDVNQPNPSDGLDVLAKVGGFEIGGIAGLVLAGAYCRRPVVIDGFISTAGALIAHTLCPTVTDYLFAGHCSVESGHRAMLKHIGLEPILDLNMRLGEGTGGALAMTVLEASTRIIKDVLTFEEAGVSEKNG